MNESVKCEKNRIWIIQQWINILCKHKQQTYAKTHSPSLHSADFLNLEDDIEMVNRSEADKL